MKTKNRWLILFVSFIANIIIGSAYAWGVLSPPLRDNFGFSPGNLALAFSFSLGLVPLSMIVSGKIKAKLGATGTILIGGIFFGAAFILGSLTLGTGSPAALFLTYGTLGGIGIGFVYGTTVPSSVQWFPDRRGLAGGIIAGGFGGGAVIFGPIFTAVMTGIGTERAVLDVFMYFGIAFGIIIILASFLITSPPAGYTPEGWTPPTPAAGSAPAVNVGVGGMLKTPRFYILWLIYTFACVTGLMIIGQAGTIAVDRIGFGVAILPVTLLGVANTGGRFFWGAVSDKIGRYPTLMLMYSMTAVMLLTLVLFTGQGTEFVFILALMGVGLCFGGFLGTFPAICAENFGTANLGMNYGVLFTAFGVAAFAGNNMSAAIFSATQSHDWAFYLAAIMSGAALVITIFMSIRSKKKAAA